MTFGGVADIISLQKVIKFNGRVLLGFINVAWWFKWPYCNVSDFWWSRRW